MRRLLNQMKLQSVLSNDTAVTQLGKVSAYDPDNYCCKVEILPSGRETGWLPVSSQWIGNQWGIFAPPSLGDIVKVHYQEGDIDSGVVAGRLYNDTHRPVHCESGVFYLIHKSGSALKFNNDGSVDLITNSDLRVQVGGDCTVDVTGDTTITSPHITLDTPITECKGNVVVSGGISSLGTYGTSGGKISTPGNVEAGGDVKDGTRTMAGDRAIYNGHTHPAPNGTTGGPNQQE